MVFRYPANNDPEAKTSSAPLGGYFTIECEDPDTGAIGTTSNIAWNTGAEWIAYNMSENIPFLASSVIGYNGVADGTANDGDRAYW